MTKEPTNAELDMRARMINLCEKLGDVTTTRKFIEAELQVTELKVLEQAFREAKSGKTEKFFCPVHGEIACPVIDMLGCKRVYCFKCFEDKREKLIESVSSDYLGWGLHGLFEQVNSEDSSDDNTSSEDEIYSKMRLSSARHKILRNLRRKKPEVFELNYQNMSVDEILKVEISDPELRSNIKKFRGIEDKESDKKLTRSFSKLRPKHQKPATKEYNSYGGGNFDFSYEVHLKEKYSSTKFDFLTGVIHYYQKYLRNYPEERYPSVSELIIKSGQNICKDEEDIVARYYDVLYKKGDQKKMFGKIASNSKDESVEAKGHLERNEIKKNVKCLSPDELYRARKNSVLDLSSKSIAEIPYSLWAMDSHPTGLHILGVSRISSMANRRTKNPKPIAHLNLNHNKLKRFCPYGSLCETLIQLSLVDNRITYLSNDFGGIKNLQTLELENNMLTELPDSFCNLISLKDLNLRRNCLVQLPNNFGNLKKLRTIDLRWNKLTKLPDTFEDLSSLGNLCAAYNKLKNLPLDLNNLYNLIILDVSYNKICEMPALTDMPKLLLVNAMGNFIKEFPNFSNCKTLCEIRLDGNRIKTLRTEFLKDCPVVQLTLSHNKIGTIPNDFYTVETLVLLDFTYNRITNLPWSIARLKYLSSIRVEENHIQNITKEVIEAGSKEILNFLLRNLLVYDGNDTIVLKAKTDLEALYVKGETSQSVPISRSRTLDASNLARTRCFIRKRLELKALPNDWIKLAMQHRVTVVDISKNKFRYIPATLKLLSADLVELTLRENLLKSVPDFIGRMPKLVILDLSFNCLDNLPLSMATCHLTKLSCRRNLFTSIPKVVFMIQTIEQLDFSENSIKEIDVDGLRNLRRLRQLNLSKNEIKRIPSSLGYFTNLKHLDITDNPFKIPGIQIIMGGTQVILDYLKRHPNFT